MIDKITKLLRASTGFGMLFSIIFLYRSATVEGDAVSLVLLTSMVTLILISLGVGIAVLSIFLFVKWHQASFQMNAKENLGIMQKMQTVLNSQNTQLLKQVDMSDATPPFMIEDGIFDEL